MSVSNSGSHSCSDSQSLCESDYIDSGLVHFPTFTPPHTHTHSPSNLLVLGSQPISLLVALTHRDLAGFGKSGALS